MARSAVESGELRWITVLSDPTDEDAAYYNDFYASIEWHERYPHRNVPALLDMSIFQASLVNQMGDWPVAILLDTDTMTVEWKGWLGDVLEHWQNISGD